ncbi:hypothetical protein KL929_002255 [Ogataea haglerorum]|uniref:uncharacterized protein n=1 Tax=Ogataea haglerorum TaxID=1937702 RepID=UPI001C88F751|nr:uncharacterized protein KL911_001951 [Ogataea haglerorum]KAG7719588.1 hypothetical protein KL913_001557 [Ogataea haglerorum]KAG7721435.1 hypothetical protein KL949_001167 [Ogataea haglerorum]KAG7749094.1 hypothetical protein KL912_002156 [Ogataea haglerorum]KAG7754512.1 hypothetical protein KL911_001951 [Ogataea haglerorum]KAG7769765.1 hypothetical protein KL931_002284 [Ogataea haglerorum]
MAPKYKTKKQKDFDKRRLKVGKTVTKSSNLTNTAFQSKSIRVKSQLLSGQNDDPEYVKLLSLLKHHSSSSRHEVLVQIEREIERHDFRDNFPFDQLVSKLKPLILDESKFVRERCMIILKKLASTKTELLVLHQSSIVLFVLSGMSHISQSIRNDSVKFLDILIDFEHIFLTNVVVRDHWGKILRNFIHLIGWRSGEPQHLTSQSTSFRVTTNTATLNSIKSTTTKSRQRLFQVKLLNKFLELGAMSADRYETNADNTLISQKSQIHSTTSAYMIPRGADPYGNLKLMRFFNPPTCMEVTLAKSKECLQKHSARKTTNINLEDYSSHDLINRRKLLMELYYEGILEGVTEIMNDDDSDSDLKSAASSLERLLKEIAFQHNEDVYN